MDSFMKALEQKNPRGVLAAFSKTIPWRQASTDISEMVKPIEQRLPKRLSRGYYYSDFAKDLLRKARRPGDWHFYFFGESQGEMTSRLGLLAFREWTYIGDGTFGLKESSIAETRSYMKWAKQDGRWYFVEYGEVLV
jgi:hypothetical protein